ncbi:hypothetical protein GCM10010211_50490 [Streptomyces albospinus]|uniref:Uncharacterized protein n=1 Tax=Streptomyces albospinus TaxID=285515 RepID=A0ABQ2VBH7_9ACTN|nr:hypothetical protein GCM10010211_50490 [Streptomyces albospinus]
MEALGDEPEEWEPPFEPQAVSARAPEMTATPAALVYGRPFRWSFTRWCSFPRTGLGRRGRG